MESLTIGPEGTVHWGDSERPDSLPFESLTVQNGGVLVPGGALTLNVAGDVRNFGQILSKPRGKESAGGPAGMAPPGLDQASPEQRVGGGGSLGERTSCWRMSSTRAGGGGRQQLKAFFDRFLLPNQADVVTRVNSPFASSQKS